MKLDFIIDEVINNYFDNEKGYCYDTVNWEIKVFNDQLLYLLKTRFNMDLKFDTPNIIEKDDAYAVWNFIHELNNMFKGITCFNGTFGTRYLNDVLQY